MLRMALGILAMVTLTTGCSTHRAWLNTQPQRPSAPHGVAPSESRSMVAAVTLSGGGTRAAAFGLGVLRELKATPLDWDGRRTTLMDEIGFVSGVSGGSVLAAYYAAFGDATFDRFEREFLDVDLESRLLRMALVPQRLHHLSSPWFGRSHVVAEELDRLFQGKTLGDAASRPGAPELVITATDLRHGGAFEFSSDQLKALCVDWRQLPLSFAVAASAAVPVLLSPLTLQNHAGSCGEPVAMRPLSTRDFRSQLREAMAQSYQDAARRPYVHLVDGGVADNLGLRGLLDRFVAGGSIASGFAEAAPGSIRRLVLIVVNAERDVSEAIEHSDRVPTITQVLDSLVFGAGARETQTTLAILREDVARWSAEMETLRCEPGSPFAPDAELHVVVVSLSDVEDEQLRVELLRVPTSLALPVAEVRRLQQAGRRALRQSPDFQRLLRSLGHP